MHNYASGQLYQRLSCCWSGLWVNWHYYFSHNTLIPFLSLTHSLCSEPGGVRKVATVSLFYEKVAAGRLFQDRGLAHEVKDLHTQNAVNGTKTLAATQICVRNA